MAHLENQQRKQRKGERGRWSACGGICGLNLKSGRRTLLSLDRFRWWYGTDDDVNDGGGTRFAFSRGERETWIVEDVT